LSGMPFEVLNVVVSMLTRLIFSFRFHHKRTVARRPDIPFLLVYEEAHNYVPRRRAEKFSSVRVAVERVAKEGRKYGISLMIVSQRPSEVSETVFSQCNTFVAMRLTNQNDQQYVQRLLPDSIVALTETLPTLERQEAILIGDSVTIPSVVRINNVDQHPDSHDILFHTEWSRDWAGLQLDELLAAWRS